MALVTDVSFLASLRLRPSILVPRQASSLCAVLLAVILVIALVRYTQSRLYLSDLKVYYGACRVWLGLPLDPFFFGTQAAQLQTHVQKYNPYTFFYGLPTGYFKYAPAFLLFFTPLCFLPWAYLCALYPICSAFAIYLAVKKLADIVKNRIAKGFLYQVNWVEKSFMWALCLQSHNIYREILIGNINGFLLLLFAFWLDFTLRGKQRPSSLCLSALVVLKPHFLILGLVLAAMREYRLLWRTLLCVGIWFLLPALVVGMPFFVQLLQGWNKALYLHNNPMAYMTNSLDITYMLGHVLGFFGWHLAPSTVPVFVRLCAVGGVLAAGLVFVAAPSVRCLQHTLFAGDPQALFVKQACAALAVIPFVLPVDTNQLVYTLPFTAIVCLHVLAGRGLRSRWGSVAFVGFLGTLGLVVLTQQIPKGVWPAHAFMGCAYLLLFSWSFWPNKACQTRS